MPGGIWDVKYFIMSAWIKKVGKIIKEAPLKYDNKPSRFIVPFEIRERGSYELIVSVFEPRSGNTGLARVSFIVK